MAKGRETKLAFGRLIFGTALLVALSALLWTRRLDSAWFIQSAALAVVLLVATVPFPGVGRAALLVVFAPAIHYAAMLVGVLSYRSSSPVFAFAIAGFLGAAAYALLVHAVLLRRFDPAMACLAGFFTLPSALAVLASDSGALVVQQCLWLMLFATGLGVSARVRSRLDAIELPFRVTQ